MKHTLDEITLLVSSEIKKSCHGGWRVTTRISVQWLPVNPAWFESKTYRHPPTKKQQDDAERRAINLYKAGNIKVIFNDKP